MNLFKKALIAILSVGLVTVPATREVETVEAAVNHTGGYVYFLKPETWTESTVMMFIGHDSYTSVFTMTKVSNTDNLYRYTMPSWNGATYVSFANASSAWGTGSWGPSNRTNATHYTNVYNNYGFNSGSYYVVVPANDSNNAGISIEYKGKSASTINLTARANVYCDKVSNAAAGTVSVSGYYMSAYNTASTRSAVSSTSSVAYASTTLAPGSTATFTATSNDGYDFLGWSTSSEESNIVSSNTTYEYKYDISYSEKTIYALFKEKATEGPTEEELNEAKEEAIYALNNYKDYSGYNDEVKTSIQNIISAAESEINAATSLSDISTILANAKDDIDGIVELEDSKISAIESLDAIDYVKYSEENQNSIKAIVNEAITKINNATSVDEVTTALNEANTKISNIKTLEQEFDELHKYDYLVVGTFDKAWDTKDLTYKFELIDNNRYEVTLDLVVGDEFKIVNYGTWDNSIGYHDSMSTTMKTLFGNNGGNLVSKVEGTYTLVLRHLNTPSYKDLFVKGEDKWSVIGLNGDWGTDHNLTYNAKEKRYEAIIDVENDSEFKFRLGGSWDNNVGKNGNNISIKAGKYLFWVDENNVMHYDDPFAGVGFISAFDAKAELAFGYEYDENGVITAVNNMKARFGTDYVALSSYSELNISDYGIRLDKGDKMTDKPYTKTWKYSSDLAEDNIVGKFTYNEETSEYTEVSENPTHIRWALTINNIPTTYYNGNFTYECFIVVDGVEYTVSNRRTESVVSLAETYAGMDSIAEGHKKACQYIVDTYKVVEA